MPMEYRSGFCCNCLVELLLSEPPESQLYAAERKKKKIYELRDTCDQNLDCIIVLSHI